MFSPIVKQLIEDAIKRHENKESLEKLRKEAVLNKIDYANRLIIDTYPDKLAELQNAVCNYCDDLKLNDQMDVISKNVTEAAKANGLLLMQEISRELELPINELGMTYCDHEADLRFTKPFFPMRCRVTLPEKYIKDLKAALNEKEIKMNPVGKAFSMQLNK